MTARSSNNDFRCLHCSSFVSAMAALSGVHNRNHCPYCLWSRHLDLVAGGDRLSACKAPMRPIGLTMKPGHNRYAPAVGELMLVHLCEDCGHLSINRIAADDDAQTLAGIFSSSSGLSFGIRQALLVSGIRLLERGSEKVIQRQLQGTSASSLAC
jgi:DNA-directed RNA polymerase subunit RPC12/RpoP